MRLKVYVNVFMNRYKKKGTVYIYFLIIESGTKNLNNCFFYKMEHAISIELQNS
jgi:hypothetical protein